MLVVELLAEIGYFHFSNHEPCNISTKYTPGYSHIHSLEGPRKYFWLEEHSRADNYNMYVF